MTHVLEELEQRRQKLYQQLQEVGDFRPGTISSNYRRCGKAGCACAQTGHPGHGPQYLWNTTQGGKSRAESLRLGPELEKVEQELDNYWRFQRLCSELIEVNLQICQRRPIPEIRDETQLEQLKKKLQRKYSKRSNVK
jgi:Family of unknown function (DUF6788)